jgi:cell cycle checkpoint protein
MSPPKGLLDTIVESSNGDIRSAIMGLQFACSTLFGSGKKSKGKGGKKAATEAAKMIALTNREQSLQLFHLMGKVLYNKRKIFRQNPSFVKPDSSSPTGKNDPPNPSATAKDIAREKALDDQIQDPVELPRWLEEEQRRGSRVQVDVSGGFFCWAEF